MRVEEHDARGRKRESARALCELATGSFDAVCLGNTRDRPLCRHKVRIVTRERSDRGDLDNTNKRF